MDVYIPGTGVRNLGSCQPCGISGLGGFLDTDTVAKIVKSYPGGADQVYNNAIRQELEALRTKNGLRLIDILTQMNVQLNKVTGLRGKFQTEALALRSKYPQLAKGFYVWLVDLYKVNVDTHDKRYKNNLGYREWWRGQLLRRYSTARTEFDYLMAQLNNKLKSSATLRTSTKADLADMRKSYWGDLAKYVEKALPNLNIGSAPVVVAAPVPSAVPAPTPVSVPAQVVATPAPVQVEIPFEERYQTDPEFRLAWLNLQDSVRQKQGLEFIAAAKKLNERIKQDVEYRKFMRADLLSMWKTHPELAKAYYVWLSNLYVFSSNFFDLYRKNLGVRRWYRGQLLRLSNENPSAFQGQIRRIDTLIKSDANYRTFFKADIEAMKKDHFADVAELLEKNLQYLGQVMKVSIPDTVPAPPASILDDTPVISVTPSVNVVSDEIDSGSSAPVVSIGEPTISEPESDIFTEEEVFGEEEIPVEEEKKLTLSKLLLPVGLALGLGVGLLAVMRK